MAPRDYRVRGMLLLLALASSVLAARAQDAAHEEFAARGGSLPARAVDPSTELPAELDRILTELAREYVPATIERSHNWGNTRPVLRGWEISADGLRLRAKPQWKDVNDGAWQRYKITLVEPEKNVALKLANVRSSPGKWELDLEATALLHLEGRHAQWQRGMQLFSVRAEGQARVVLRAHVTIGCWIDLLAAKAEFRPRVTSADLELTEFQLHRVGDLHGPVVRSLSAPLREVLEEKLAHDQEKLVHRLNAALEKRFP